MITKQIGIWLVEKKIYQTMENIIQAKERGKITMDLELIRWNNRLRGLKRESWNQNNKNTISRCHPQVNHTKNYGFQIHLQ